MNKYSVLLVDDHKLFREGLKLLLSSVDCIGQISEASNGKEFLIQIKDNKPDIVFIDIDMPEMNGIEATQKAVEIYPNINIIALSMYGDDDYYTQMINAGAKGFVLKNTDIQEVEKAIIEVMCGKNYFSQEILGSLILNLNRKRIAKKCSELSERECEILYHICKGLSNQEIGQTLSLSKRTVDKHRENLLLKTNSKNTAELVVFAIKNNIIEI